MKPQRLEELVFAYEVATQFPDVSGAEHLDMLLIRSDIENYTSQLTHAQMQRLALADNRLMRQARLSVRITTPAPTSCQPHKTSTSTACTAASLPDSRGLAASWCAMRE